MFLKPVLSKHSCFCLLHWPWPLGFDFIEEQVHEVYLGLIVQCTSGLIPYWLCKMERYSMSGYVTEANSRGWSSTGSSSTEWNFVGSTKRLLPLHFQKFNSFMYLLPIYFYSPSFKAGPGMSTWRPAKFKRVAHHNKKVLNLWIILDI